MGSSVTTFKRRTGKADSLVHPGCGEGGAPSRPAPAALQKSHVYVSLANIGQNTPKHQKVSIKFKKKKYFEHAFFIVFTGKNPPTPQQKVGTKNDSNTSQTNSQLHQTYLNQIPTTPNLSKPTPNHTK